MLAQAASATSDHGDALITSIAAVVIAIIGVLTTLLRTNPRQASDTNAQAREANTAVNTVGANVPSIQSNVAETAHQVIQLHERLSALSSHTESLWPVAQEWRAFMEKWDDLPANLSDAASLTRYLLDLQARLAALEAEKGSPPPGS